jgi:hypothetical protein
VDGRASVSDLLGTHNLLLPPSRISQPQPHIARDSRLQTGQRALSVRHLCLAAMTAALTRLDEAEDAVRCFPRCGMFRVAGLHDHGTRRPSTAQGRPMQAGCRLARPEIFC